MPFLVHGQFFESIADAIRELKIISIHDIDLDNPQNYAKDKLTGLRSFTPNLTVDTEIAQDYLSYPERTETLLKSLPGSALRFYQQFQPYHRQHWIRWFDEKDIQRPQGGKTSEGYPLPEEIGTSHIVIDPNHPRNPNFFTAYWYDPLFHLSACYRAQCFLTPLDKWIQNSAQRVIILNESLLELETKVIQFETVSKIVRKKHSKNA